MMDREGTKYERVLQQEEPEAALGASIDGGAHAVADEDDPENLWPMDKGEGNTALGSTQFGLGNDIERIVNELTKVADIDANMLQHGALEQLLTTSNYSNQTPSPHDEATASSTISCPNRHLAQGPTSRTEQRDATVGAFEIHSPKVSARLGTADEQVSPCLSSAQSDHSLAKAQSHEKAAKVDTTKSSSDVSHNYNVAKVISELSQLFANSSKALSAISIQVSHCAKPIPQRHDLELGPVTGSSNCKMPCIEHNLGWLEEKVIVLDQVLENVDFPDWTIAVDYYVSRRSAECLSSNSLHDDYLWFKKRILFLCCYRWDIQTLSKQDESKNEIEGHPPFLERTDAKSVQQRVRTHLVSNVFYLSRTFDSLLYIWSYETTFPIFRMAISCVLATGCAYYNDVDITLGQLLEQTFREKLLPRPATLDQITWARYSLTMIKIAEAVSSRRSIYAKSLSQDLAVSWDDIGLEKFLSKTFSSLFAERRFSGPGRKPERRTSWNPDVEKNAGSSPNPKFYVHDLDIKSLQRIGGIRIEWTDDFEEHLHLHLAGRNILYVCWTAYLPTCHHITAQFEDRTLFSAVDACFLLASRPHNGSERDIAACMDFTAVRTRGEIQRSWAFLFREGTRSAAYQALEAPRGLVTPTVPKTRSWSKIFGLRPRYNHLGLECRAPLSMKDLLSKWPESFPETRLHANRDPFTNEDSQSWWGTKKAIKRHKELDFGAFTVYEQRLRYLRKHMDDCRPKDFWGLVYDRRNTLQYYTFWSVIAVGFLSILLGLMSLAVGIAQAVFAYRALNLPVAATTTSSTT